MGLSVYPPASTGAIDTANTPYLKAISSDSTSVSDGALYVGTDSSGNVYSVGNVDYWSGNGFIIKQDSSGNILWQKQIFSGSTNYGLYFQKAVVDASGNIYIGGKSWQGSGSTQYRQNTVWKFDTNGNLQWNVYAYRNADSYMSAMNVDANGNVYIADAFFQGGYYAWLTKFNSSGVRQWSGFAYQGNTYHQVYTYDILFDSSNNPILIGHEYNQTADTNNIIVTKINESNSTAIFRYSYRLSGASCSARKAVLDSSGNIYIAYADSNTVWHILKLDSAGNVVWDKYYMTADPNAIALGEDGYLYLCGSGYKYYGGNQSQYLWISKVDTSGALQWIRSVSVSVYSSMYANQIDASKPGYIYLAGSFPRNGGQDAIIMKLKKDGSGTGTYALGNSNITYASTSASATSATMTKVGISSYWGDNQTPDYTGNMTLPVYYTGFMSAQTTYLS